MSRAASDVPGGSGPARGAIPSPFPDLAGSAASARRPAFRAAVTTPAGPVGDWLTAGALIVALILLLPLLTVLASIFYSGDGTWQHLAATVLPGYVGNTAALIVLVGSGTLVVGTGTAWLVTMCRFPGHGVLKWALVLPLTVPAYVIAYAYTDFLQHSGPVQSLLRSATGWGPRDYWFPNVRSLWGAALMFTLVLYPYVYMLARAAFLQQSGSAFATARTLGCGPWRAFLLVVVPMARPALAGGVTLALMETLADFGTVAHFGVQTFTTGIYRAWFSIGDRNAAMHLAVCLVGFVFLVLVLERWQRRRAPNRATSKREPITPIRLTGARAWLAFTAAFLPLALGFILPVAILAELAQPYWGVLAEPRYLDLIRNSFTLSGTGAVVTVALALLLAYAARVNPGPVTAASNRLVSLGYALPGSIIAVGLLVPLATFDNQLDAFMRATFDISTGLLLTGTATALIYGYTVRFMAVALNAVEAGLATVTSSMDQAARALGSAPLATLMRVHLPIIRGGLLTAALIVFVDIMKELPATLIMRPFNFDTLAIQAYRLASDERLAQAAVPSLVIVAVGLLPVVVLSRAITRQRG